MNFFVNLLIFNHFSLLHIYLVATSAHGADATVFRLTKFP
jgi:hypothetical protein